MNFQDLQPLVDSAFKYGPFFFSVLFVIFLTRWAYRQYTFAVTRDPPLSAADQNENRLMFRTTFYFGIVLVVISIVWWWVYQPTTYMFRVTIKNLQPQDVIHTDASVFIQEEKTPFGSATAGLLRNEHLLIIQTHPFRKGQAFAIDFSKDQAEPIQLLIPYTSEAEEPEFQIKFDKSSQTSVLKRIGDAPLNKAVSQFTKRLGRPVFAAERNFDVRIQPNYITVLQDPYSNVGAKISAIKEFAEVKPTLATQSLAWGIGEPLALTILDLSQHSDDELAYRASSLARLLDIDGYLVGQLLSQTRSVREEAERILLRIPKGHAMDLLGRASAARYDDVYDTRDKVNSGNYTQVLKPTASAQGDRYYVRAAWDPANAKVVACLTKLFNTGLEGGRTLAQEQSLMAGRSQRYVYWYDKGWAIQIGAMIRHCGANADFVHPY